MLLIHFFFFFVSGEEKAWTCVESLIFLPVSREKFLTKNWFESSSVPITAPWVLLSSSNAVKVWKAREQEK